MKTIKKIHSKTNPDGITFLIDISDGSVFSCALINANFNIKQMIDSNGIDISQWGSSWQCDIATADINTATNMVWLIANDLIKKPKNWKCFSKATITKKINKYIY